MKLKNLIYYIMLLWTLLILFSFYFHYNNVEDAVLQNALTEVRSSYNKDLVYRRWAAKHGGVYVPVTEATPPNPYLSRVPERDIITPSGKKLTLVNPAYMTRQVHELGKEQYGVRGHITSLKLLRPENKPDKWERKALWQFEKGSAEIFGVEEIDGKKYLRLMRPTFIEHGCLKCHEHQGYKIGDVRGGISVSVPWKNYQKTLSSQVQSHIYSYGAMWLLGLAGLFLYKSQITKYISERDEKEKELKKSEDKFRRFAENAEDVIFRYKFFPEEHFEYVSPSSSNLFGYEPQEFYDDPELAFKIVHRKDLKIARQMFFKDISDKRPIIVHCIKKNGAAVWVEIRYVLLNNSKGHLSTIEGTAHDVTERKLIEEERANYRANLEKLVDNRTHELKLSEERFRTLAEHSNDSIIRIDKNMECVYVNAVLEKRTSLAQSSFIGKKIETINNVWKQKELFESAVSKTFLSKQKQNIEVELQTESVWLDYNIVPEFNDEGEVVTVLAFGRDITERKKLETSILESLVKEKELSELKTQFVSMVSHEFRTPLTTIVSSAEIINMLIEKNETERKRSHVQKIFNAAESMTSLLDDILTLNRTETGKLSFNPELIDLNNFCREITENYFALYKDHIFYCDYKCSKNKFTVDAKLLRQIIENLLTNAFKYTAAGKKVTLVITNDDNYLFIEITDEGIGIPAEEHKNLFEPFYRASNTMHYPGNGLGLSIVKKAVELHKGKINFNSTINEGTTFKAAVPI